MKRYCIDNELSDERIKEYREQFENWSDAELATIADCDVRMIWKRVIEKELLSDSVQAYHFLSDTPYAKYLYEDEKEKMEEIRKEQEKVRERLRICNPSSYIEKYIVTEVEKESCMESKLISGCDQEILHGESSCKQSVSNYIPIDTLRVLCSEDFLSDILLCISFSLQYCANENKYIPMYSENDYETERKWALFVSRGKSKFDKFDKEKKEKFTAYIKEKENEYFSEKNHTVGFVQKTKQMTPISGKIKNTYKRAPEIQDIVPNIFKAFIRTPEFRDCYKASRKQVNYKEEILLQIKQSIPQGSVHERYMFEEISGERLTKHIYVLLSQVFKLVNYDVFYSGVKDNLEEFIFVLLRCKGVCMRIALVDSFKLMKNDQFLYKISDSLSHRERTEMYVEEVLRRYTVEATNLNQYSTKFYDKLVKEMLYIFWLKIKKEGKEIYDIKKICDQYVNCRREQRMPNVGNTDLYALILKTVMHGVMQETLLI